MQRRTVVRQAAGLAFSVALGGLVPAGVTAATGDDFPNRPIRILVAYPAGGGIDTIARTFAEKLAAALRQPIVIENKPGAGGMLAADMLARAPADGYVLGMVDNGVLTIQPSVRKSVTYSTMKDFTFLGLVSRMPLVLVANPSVPASNLSELVAYSKANPDSLVFGSGGGVGNPTHISYEFLRRETGAAIRHVPYQGAAPALADLVGGHIALTFLDVRLAQDYGKDARVKVLAIGDAKRHPLLPSIPTFEESGVRNVAQPPWVGLAGPASLPPQVVARLRTAFTELAKDTELSEALTRRGYSPAVSGPDLFNALVKTDFEANQKAMKQLNITIE